MKKYIAIALIALCQMNTTTANLLNLKTMTAEEKQTKLDELNREIRNKQSMRSDNQTEANLMQSQLSADLDAGNLKDTDVAMKLSKIDKINQKTQDMTKEIDDLEKMALEISTMMSTELQSSINQRLEDNKAIETLKQAATTLASAAIVEKYNTDFKNMSAEEQMKEFNNLKSYITNKEKKLDEVQKLTTVFTQKVEETADNLEADKLTVALIAIDQLNALQKALTAEIKTLDTHVSELNTLMTQKSAIKIASVLQEKIAEGGCTMTPES